MNLEVYIQYNYSSKVKEKQRLSQTNKNRGYLLPVRNVKRGF